MTLASVLDAGVWPFIVSGLIAALLAPAAWALVRTVDARER